MALASGHAISSSEEDSDVETFSRPKKKPAGYENSLPQTSGSNSLKRKSDESRGHNKNIDSRTADMSKDPKTEGDKGKGTKDDGTPDCPHRAKCHRTWNPHHMREYKHPELVKKDEDELPQTKKRKTEESKPRTCKDILDESEPFHFLLTKVTGIPPQFNADLAVHIKDILSLSMGTLVASAQFNYMFDIPWLIQQYPLESRSKPLLIIHGEERGSRAALHEAASPYPNIKFCQAKLEIMYGTHHSKMMLLLYDNGLRVVIHTANLIEQDWHQKTQGVWISPLFPKLKASSSSGDGDSLTNFKRDLLEYISAYKSTALQTWKEHIQQHNMSSALVVLMASVPGRHMGDSKHKWGHMKLRKVLQKLGPEKEKLKNWSVVGQFSSVGSLGVDQTKYLCAEWLQSMLACRGGLSTPLSPKDVKVNLLKLIFPTVDNVRISLEGYPAGASIPYSIQNARKQHYFHSFMHQWKASHRGRSRAAPHIKTYARLSPDQKKIAWFLVTSSNMSKAAWGALEKNGSQLMIRSYEIGVLFIPQQFITTADSFSYSKEDDSQTSPFFPVPWDLPLIPHGEKDRPWVWDIPYMENPDSHGMAWCPPTKH